MATAKRKTKAAKATKAPKATKKPTKKKATKKKVGTKAPKATPASKLVSHFIVVLDSSGSMYSIADDAVEAHNRIVASIRDGARAAGQQATVTFTTFGDPNVSIRDVLVDADTIALLDRRHYRPDSMTPLFDAVGLTVERVLAKHKPKKGYDESFVVMVTTDGEENQSRKFNAAKLKTLMTKLGATDCWTFTFQLPPRAKAAFCRKYGISAGNVIEWEATSRGVAQARQQASKAVSGYFATRATGQSSTTRFYTDLSNVKAADVKTQLVDIRNEVKLFNVKAEAAIKPFVEDQGLNYVKGCSFYQLTKPETVQDYKEIVVKEKRKGAIYGGAAARDVLGIPHGTVKLAPGNHANYDIFVQSTSVNRKLVRGTTLLVRV